MFRPTFSSSFLILVLVSISCSISENAHKNTSEVATVSGFYEGTLESQQYGEVQISMNLRTESDTLLGTLITPLGDFPLSQEKLTEDQISLQFMVGEGVVGTVTGHLNTNKIEGTWKLDDDGGIISLNRIGSAKPPLQSEKAPTLELTTSEWREDLHFLASELPDFHGDAFHTVSREEFKDSVKALDSKLSSLGNHEIFAAMGRIVAMVDDGHTYLQLPSTFHRYPIRLYAFEDTLRITETSEEYKNLLGGQVLKIGGMDISEVKCLVSRQVAHENDQYVLKELPYFLTFAEILHGHGIISDIQEAQWEIEIPSEERLTVQFSPVASGEKVQWATAAQNTPLYRQYPRKDLWQKFLSESGTLYIGFRGYPESSAFGEFFDEVFQFVEQNSVKRMVIDLRQNSGGDFTKARELLLPRFKNHPLNQKNRLYVAIGRHTFSAAMTNAADFLKETNATLVVEPTGARPNGWQEKGQFTLPNSRLTVAYSKQYYQFLDEDLPAVMPHKYISLTWEDFQKGRDPVLKWIISQPIPE
jgi:hypothetical protein